MKLSLWVFMNATSSATVGELTEASSVASFGLMRPRPGPAPHDDARRLQLALERTSCRGGRPIDGASPEKGSVDDQG